MVVLPSEPPPAVVLPPTVLPLASLSTSASWASFSAESVVHGLIPECAPAVLGRLRRERVRTAEDLAGLDKDDLRDLGLTMVERSRVLRWARQVLPSYSQGTPGGVTPTGSTTPALRGKLMDAAIPPAVIEVEAEAAEASRPRRNSDCMMWELQESQKERALQMHLEEVEHQADFWCSFTSDSRAWTAKLAERCRCALEGADLANVREDLLEALFDLSPDRVREVYDSMYESAEGKISSHELAQGLCRCGLPELDEGASQLLLEKVVPLDQTDCLQLAEFQTILSRLVLAQLLTLVTDDDQQTSNGNRTTLTGNRTTLTVVDYNDREQKTTSVSSQDLRSFFFGHRPLPQKDGDSHFVRWVHMSGMDLTVLLSLAVKYGLHPLAVEDAVQQCASKAERCGQHYFATIEGLCLASAPSDTEQVQVQGHHVSLFCAGPPILDTVLTVAQPDSNFCEEWPGGGCGAGRLGPGAGGSAGRRPKAALWAEKIRRRLEAPLSRLRERRGDFLIHATVDACADELLAVVRAYAKRVGRVESTLRLSDRPLQADQVSEMSLVRLQLGMVMQRARGMQRVVRRIVDDRDLAPGLAVYLQDIGDHLFQAAEDAARLAERCGAICDGHAKAQEKEQERARRKQAELARHQELRRSVQADRQNNILFFLTLVTTVFAPIQFIAGVYGMNFVDPSGTPTIPELLWRRGYFYFWGLVVIYLVASGLLAVCVFNKMRPCHSTSPDTSALPAPEYCSSEVPHQASSSSCRSEEAPCQCHPQEAEALQRDCEAAGEAYHVIPAHQQDWLAWLKAWPSSLMNRDGNPSAPLSWSLITQQP